LVRGGALPRLRRGYRQPRSPAVEAPAPAVADVSLPLEAAAGAFWSAAGAVEALGVLLLLMVEELV
jgi:hypothetical protein